MKNITFLLTALLVVTTVTAQTVADQLDFILPKEPSKAEQIVLLKKLQRARALEEDLPSRVNNGEAKAFPPVVSQAGGSCGSASRIYYMFAHEINSLRDADGKLSENIYPSHFTWLLTYNGPAKETLARYTGIPNSVVYGGKTYSQLFGAQTWRTVDYGWMQGYDKWFHAMHNRIAGKGGTGNFGSEENREIIKRFIWNHLGDEDFSCGGIVGIGVAASGEWGVIPEGSHEAGKHYVKKWGTQVNHALTVVGYDDNIEIDMNENGTIEDKEKGAWIVVNSWGSRWNDGGFIYCPYEMARTTVGEDGSLGYWWNSDFYYARKNYRPLRTLKISMKYSDRNKLLLKAGISQDTNATRPTRTIPMEHFSYCGNDGSPMLGRWKDGLHKESMEFGYDLTDLSALYDQTKPLKYFFIIETKAEAAGIGQIDSCCLINYLFDKGGVETYFRKKNIIIEGHGKTTMISVVVSPNETTNPPRNLLLNDLNSKEVALSWQKPQECMFDVKEYQIYRNGELLVDHIPATQLNYTDNNSISVASYEVKAVYQYDALVLTSTVSTSAVRNYTVPKETTLKFRDSGFNIPDLFKDGLNQFTIEFWAKPTSVKSSNWQLGHAWGSFLFHFNTGGGISVGYSGKERIHKKGRIETNKWTHIAVVIDGQKIKLYQDGYFISLFTTRGSDGLTLRDFYIGLDHTDQGIDGEIDELRIWRSARSTMTIRNYKDKPIINPELEDDLLAYYPMDLIDGKVRDAKGGYNGILNNDNYSEEDQTTPIASLEDDAPIANFLIPNTTLYPGVTIKLQNSSTNATSFAWTVAEAGLNETNIAHPELIFETPGAYTVTLKAINKNGEVSVSKELIVEQLPLPKPDFEPSLSVVKSNQRVSFINKTEGDLCSFRWEFEGAEPAVSTARDAVTVFNKTGYHKVKLIATNPSGAQEIVKEDIIKILKIKPIASFEASDLNIEVGETVRFTDTSDNEPSQWIWTIENDKILSLTEQNPSVTFSKPGSYTIKLKALNKAGKDSIEKIHFITVRMPNAENALNFDGSNDYVTVDNLFSTDALSEFTIEWWSCPTTLKEDGFRIGNDASTLLITTSLEGHLKAIIGHDVVKSGAVVKLNEWAHYTLTYKEGRAILYKNGKRLVYRLFKNKTAPAWSKGFSLGSSDIHTISGFLDEFRVWKVALTPYQIIENINYPLANPTTFKDLELYYQFNQNSGDVVDAMGSHLGTRVNFGPDGDAWSPSEAFGASSSPNKVKASYEWAANTFALSFEQYLGDYNAVFMKKEIDRTGQPIDEVKYKVSDNDVNPASESMLENSDYVCVYNGRNNHFTLQDYFTLPLKGKYNEAQSFSFLIAPYNKVRVLKDGKHTSLPFYFGTTEVSLQLMMFSDELQEQIGKVAVFTYNDVIDVQLSDPYCHTVKLMNVYGQTVYQIETEGNHIRISRSMVGSGIYFITIDNAQPVKVVF